MIIFYVPCKDQKEAETIARNLLSKKLIACANIVNAESMYFWENKLEVSGEFILLMKTSESKEKGIFETVKELHSYDVPCIAKFNVVCNKEYSDWVDSQLK